jgi:hypothetical protein
MDCEKEPPIADHMMARCKSSLDSVLSKAAVLGNSVEGRFAIGIFLYTLSYLLLLLNPGYYWDDWVWIGNPLEAPKLQAEAGMRFGLCEVLRLLIVLDSPVLAYKAIVFACNGGAAILFYWILNSIPVFKKHAFYLAILFAVIPLNFARQGASHAHYALSLLCFYSGVCVTIFWKSVGLRGIITRVIALGLFWLSFSVNSFLFFYGIAMLLMYTQREEQISFASAYRFSLKYIDFMLLPIVFWVCKSMYMKPYGEFVGYNQITIERILSVPKYTLKSFSYNFVSPVFGAFSLPKQLDDITAALCIVTIIYRFKKFENIRAHGRALGIGLLLFFSGVIPYLAVGKMPRMHDWDGRHQLLLGAGCSILFYFAYLTMLNRKDPSFPAFWLLIFVYYNNIANFEYLRSWLKSEAIMSEMSSSSIIETHGNFIVQDECLSSNAFGEGWAFYDYTGMYYAATRRQGKIFASKNDYKHASEIPKEYQARYKIEGAQHREAEYVITIAQKVKIGRLETLRLLWNFHTNKELFFREIAGYFEFTYSRC